MTTIVLQGRCVARRFWYEACMFCSEARVGNQPHRPFPLMHWRPIIRVILMCLACWLAGC